MIKLMGLVYIKINQDLDMKVTGKMIFKKVKELKLGQMALLIQVPIKKVKKMVLVNFYGQIKVPMKVSFSIIKQKEKDFIYGMMEDITEVIGKKVKCMAQVLIIGLMAVSMRGNTQMIKNKEKVHLFGLMDANILENGLMGSNMAKGHILPNKA